MTIHNFMNVGVASGATVAITFRPNIDLDYQFQINKIVIEEACREYFNIVNIKCQLNSQLKTTDSITAKRFHELQNLSDILYKGRLDPLHPGCDFRIDVQNISKQMRELSGYIEGKFI